MTSEKQKALERAVLDIEKQYGKGAIMKLGDTVSRSIEVIHTVSLTLDIALGVGGVPRGRIIEIYGPESSGKTTLALHIIAEVQKAGGIAAIVDAEHALDAGYAKNLGVDTDNLLISQPDHGEQALEITEHLVRSGAVEVVVVDSVAAWCLERKLREMGDSHVGLQARLMSQALRKLTAAIGRSNCTVILRTSCVKNWCNVWQPGNDPGGRALKFYASVRLDIRRIETLKKGNEMIGNRTRVRVLKNKVAPPFKEAEFDIIYGLGISRHGDILDLAAELDIVNKSGSWYSYGDLRLGQGRENAREFLLSNPELTDEIEQKVRVAKNLVKPEEVKEEVGTKKD